MLSYQYDDDLITLLYEATRKLVIHLYYTLELLFLIKFIANDSKFGDHNIILKHYCDSVFYLYYCNVSEVKEGSFSAIKDAHNETLHRYS